MYGGFKLGGIFVLDKILIHCSLNTTPNVHQSISEASEGKYINFKICVDMKICILFQIMTWALFLSSCGKKEPVRDAEFWYKKSLQELCLSQPGEIAWRTALGSVDKALVLDKTRERYWVLKGTLLLKLGMPQMSKNAFEQALHYVAVPSLRAEVLNNYACALAELGDELKAFALWQEALATPTYQTPEIVYCNQGQYWLIKQQYDKAIIAFDRAIQISGEYSDAYFYRALSHYHLKEYSHANDVITTLLSFDPNYQPALALKRDLIGKMSPVG